MIPLFFGEWERRLFGAYDPPQGIDQRLGVIVCYPVGPEYYRAYSACQWLARRLAMAGAHVLRFDYYGTGDSAGDMADVTLPDWQRNVEEAVEELEDLANLRSVAAVGLRFGAALAASVADTRDDIDRLVMWDPILSGIGCLRELESLLVPGRSADRNPGEPFELKAEFYDHAFIDSLEGFVPLQRHASLPPTLIMSTRSETAYQDVIKRIAEAGIDHSLALRPGPCVWDESQDIVNSGVPVEALTEIVEWITKAA